MYGWSSDDNRIAQLVESVGIEQYEGDSVDRISVLQSVND